jgi:hypothetical protein
MSNAKPHWKPVFASGLLILAFARVCRDAMRMLELDPG